jgi:hypothetical protein
VDTQYIDQELSDLDAKLKEVKELTSKAEAIQSDLNDTAAKELTVFTDDSLSNEDKTKRLIELRTYGEVVKNSLLKANAALYAAEDVAVQIGISVNNSLGGFRDAIRATALEKTRGALNALLFLQKGEDLHFSQRARTVYALDRMEVLSFVGNNRQNSLLNLPKLRRVYNELLALA